MSSPPGQPSEQEMRAAYEAELRRIMVGDVVMQTVVSLVNLAGRRLGPAGGGSSEERDLDQVMDAIDAVRGLLPVLERRHAAELGPVRDALASLQMAYARERATTAAGDLTPATPSQTSEPAVPGSGSPTAPKEPTPGPSPTEDASGPGPAQSSGRLWVPGR